MEVKDILRNLREKNHLTQEQMAERINVTRQAVSRWETGMTQPNPELLKVLSREFGVFGRGRENSDSVPLKEFQFELNYN